MTPEEADSLHQAYRRQRKAWAKAINHPYPKKKDPDDLTPPPAVIDGVDEELASFFASPAGKAALTRIERWPGGPFIVARIRRLILEARVRWGDRS